MKNNKTKILKIILTITVVALIIAVLVYLFPLIKNLSTEQGRLEFKEKIDEWKFWGFLVLFGLQVAQIFLFIVPGEPIEILTGMCYGGLWGTIFILISAGLISTGIFFMVRKFGRKFVYNFCDKEKVQKIENSKLFQNPNKIEKIMFILFILPGTPKDLLVYILGLLPVKPLKFIVVSTIARIPSIISSTLAGANIATGNWKMSIMIYLAIIIPAIILILIMNKFDKDKTAVEALKVINK